jgi:hypothetical protein
MPTPLKALAMVVVVSGIALQSFAQDDPHPETRSGRRRARGARERPFVR